MNSRQYKLLKHSLPFFVIVFNIPQVIVTCLYFYDDIVGLLGVIVLLFLLSYYVSFELSRIYFSQYNINPDGAIVSPFAIIVLFLIVTFSLAFTAPEVALFSSIKGATGDLLFDARAAFTKGREGVELVLVYVYAMLLKGGLPIAILYLFHKKNKYCWLFLFLVLFALLLSLEKSLTAMLIMPIALYYYIIGEKKKLYGFVVFGLLFLVFASILSKSSEINQVELSYNKYAKIEFYSKDSRCNYISDFEVINQSGACGSGFEYKKVSLAKQDDYRFILGSTGIEYFVNRIVWIPFVTSYDNLKYWMATYSGKFLLGATSLPLALIFDLHFVNIEQAVFIDQFGGEDDSPGRANTFFAVDSYINFGFFGVVMSSALCGILFGWFSRCSSPVVASAAVVTSFSLANNSLIPMIWSGGILVLIILVIIWKCKLVVCEK